MSYSASITCFNVLPPAVVRAIHEAFDEAVGSLYEQSPITPWEMRARERVARRIVDLARHGECDVIRLRDGGLAILGTTRVLN